jgi:N-acetyl-anhydromuramyl-L-alanine amidase AmpD
MSAATPKLIPEDWMPKCTMTRIITHWTVGRYDPNETDLAAYHLLIDGDGALHRGKHPISANAAGKKMAGDSYAAHTKGCNTGSIGVSICGMFVADGVGIELSKYPFKRVQWNMMCFVVATLAMRYGIPVDNKHILGHGEVEANLDIKQNGKIDPLWLPWQPKLTRPEVGNLMRMNVKLYMGQSGQLMQPIRNPLRPPSMWA